MSRAPRTRLEEGGRLRLPGDLVERLGWKEGTHLEAVEEEGTVRLRRIEVDPFAEAFRKPDEGAFDEILRRQKQSREDAFRAFDEKVRKGELPEARPEDHPEHWR